MEYMHSAAAPTRRIPTHVWAPLTVPTHHSPELVFSTGRAAFRLQGCPLLLPMQLPAVSTARSAIPDCRADRYVVGSLIAAAHAGAGLGHVANSDLGEGEAHDSPVVL